MRGEKDVMKEQGKAVDVFFCLDGKVVLPAEGQTIGIKFWNSKKFVPARAMPCQKYFVIGWDYCDHDDDKRKSSCGTKKDPSSFLITSTQPLPTTP